MDIMKRKTKIRLAIILAAVSLGTVVGVALWRYRHPDTSTYEITFVQTPSMGGGPDWSLTVDSQGEAAYRVSQPPKDFSRRGSVTVQRGSLNLSKADVALFRRALSESRFFTCPEAYGKVIVDSAWRTITVKTQNREKTVTLGWMQKSSLRVTTEERAAMTKAAPVDDLWKTAEALVEGLEGREKTKTKPKELQNRIPKETETVP